MVSCDCTSKKVNYLFYTRHISIVSRTKSPMLENWKGTLWGQKGNLPAYSFLTTIVQSSRGFNNYTALITSETCALWSVSRAHPLIYSPTVHFLNSDSNFPTQYKFTGVDYTLWSIIPHQPRIHMKANLHFPMTVWSASTTYPADLQAFNFGSVRS